MSEVKLVIADYDGVFNQGTEAGYYTCFAHAVGSVGVVLADEELKRRLDQTWGGAGSVHLEGLLHEKLEGMDPLERLSVIYDAEAVYNDHLLGGTFARFVDPVPGGQTVVPDLKAEYGNLQVAMITGRHPRILEEEMHSFGIDTGEFSSIKTAYGLHDPSLSKPNPHLALETMEELEVAPKEVISVGDAVTDVKMAQAAGIGNIVVVLTGQIKTAEQARDLGAKYIIPDITHLGEIVETIQQNAHA